MADARRSQANTGSNIDDICGVIKGSDCVMCYNLKLELESVLQEISSARKIIQILQDDVKKEAENRTAIPGDHQWVKDIFQSVNSQIISEEAGQICRNQKIHTVKTKGFKIPTIVNGKIQTSEVRKCATPEDKSTRLSRNMNLKSSHKLLIIGDSHLKSNTTNIEQYLNTKFAVYIIIKPGATINQIVLGQEK